MLARFSYSQAGDFVFDPMGGRVLGVHNSNSKFDPNNPVVLNEVPFEELVELALAAEEAAELKRKIEFDGNT